MTTLAILVTTYAPAGGESRVEAVERSVNSWKKHLKFSGERHVHVADDGSERNMNFGKRFWMNLIGDWASLSFSRQERGGLGASLNAGLAACADISPFVLYPMDDWSLVCDLDLEPWVRILAENDDVGCIRMGQPSGSVRGGRGRRFQGHVTVSFERYAFYWSLVPALYHSRFFDAYGSFSEQASAGQVERDYNAQICASSGPDVLVAMLTPWQHLWSVRLGDIVPGQAVPPERLGAKVNPHGYEVA